MGDIKHLPDAVHSSVRSGIILFNLTRVVEELIFNSLDAGATKIYVAIGVGTCYVKVVDNGCGIDREGLMLLGERYATSKSDQLADTDSVARSFGFRGEALSSISDVSLLEVITKAHGKPNGYRKVIKECKCLYLGIDDGRQDVGTTVIVRDLFYNQPVRRKHIQSSTKKVLQSVKKSVLRIALVHPKVFLKLVDIESEDELFCTAPSSSPLSLVMSNLGIEVCGSLCELNVSDGVLKLSGYMSSPCDTSFLKAFQYVYINSRYIFKCPIHKLLNQLAAGSNFLDMQKAKVGSQNSKRSRSQTDVTFILDLSCPRSWYDLTFEPSKTSVEFRDWFPILGFIEKAITDFWSENFSYGHGHPLAHGTGRSVEDKVKGEADNRLLSEEETSELKHLQRSSGMCQLHSEPTTLEAQLVCTSLACRPDKKKVADDSDVKKFKVPKNSEGLYICSRDSVEEFSNPLDSQPKWGKSCQNTVNGNKLHNLHEGAILDISSGILHLAGDSLVPESMNRNCIEDAKVLQQVDKKFIAVVGSGVLALIDQHAADERIRLEELRQKVLSGEKKTITYLDTEKKLVLPETGYQLLHNYAEQVHKWGWLCNFHGRGSRSFRKNLNLLHKEPTVVTVLAVPCILGVNLTDGDLLEFLQQLADTDGSSTIPPSVLRILNSKACRGAIMFGDALLPSECSLIVEELRRTSLCFQCAHGRPTTVPLVNLEALHKQIQKLGSSDGVWDMSWRGLCRQELSLERATCRLKSARDTDSKFV
ncbi:DNA mismatch repair protein MLH3 isoform X7 [Diospyros lotus]|uniref:DNA mismatch repair protein MLH3 isoform X7 n=1 Tax=Diospyros lotus TaxID=55363 RepID=UPI0022501E2C|nr:DNA mismatch repair protein MLH3 isoform X7 [Diospyros lotus]